MRDKIKSLEIYYYNDGRIYEGEWKDNTKEGKGIFYCNNEHKNKREWKYKKNK